jgi:hypothetical protein
MCKAFSCIVGRDKKVTWKFGTDSHEDLIKIAGYNDDTLDPEKIEFCRIEISPKNGSYLDPDEWVFKIDMDVTPTWWTLDHKKACEREFKKWKKQLYKILVQKAIIHPFHDVVPPTGITEEHIALVREWDSVRDSSGFRSGLRSGLRSGIRSGIRSGLRLGIRSGFGLGFGLGFCQGFGWGFGLGFGLGFSVGLSFYWIAPHGYIQKKLIQRDTRSNLLLPFGNLD